MLLNRHLILSIIYEFPTLLEIVTEFYVLNTSLVYESCYV